MQVQTDTSSRADSSIIVMLNHPDVSILVINKRVMLTLERINAFEHAVAYRTETAGNRGKTNVQNWEMVLTQGIQVPKLAWCHTTIAKL